MISRPHKKGEYERGHSETNKGGESARIPAKEGSTLHQSGDVMATPRLLCISTEDRDG